MNEKQFFFHVIIWCGKPSDNACQQASASYVSQFFREIKHSVDRYVVQSHRVCWKVPSCENTCNKIRTLWKSALPASLKISFFRAAVESILLYGTEGWKITNKLEARLDGCYTRLLMMVLDLNWKGHHTREEIYGNFPKVFEVVRERRLNFVAHCSRRQNEPVSELVFWMRSPGTRAQGKPRLTYPKLLSQDTGLEP